MLPSMLKRAARPVVQRAGSRTFGNLVSDFAKDMAAHRQANPELYKSKSLADLAGERAAAKAIIQDAQTPPAVEKFAVAAAGVHYGPGTTVFGNASSYRLNGGKGGALKAKEGPATKADNLTAGFSSEGKQEISYEDSDSIVDAAVAHLGGQSTLYLEDASCGSADGNVLVRGVTDEASTAAVMKGLLERTSDTFGGNRPVTLYASSSLNAKAPTTLVHSENGEARVVCAGQLDPLSMLGALADAVNEASPGTLLPCDVHIKGEDVTLVFDSTAAARAKAFKSGELFAGHHAILTDNGVSRAWGGVVVAAKGASPGDGDVVVGDVVVASRPSANSVGMPTSAKFKKGSIKFNGDIAAFKEEIMEKLGN